MKTYKQIISEVGQLGYEYAAGINIRVCPVSPI